MGLHLRPVADSERENLGVADRPQESSELSADVIDDIMEDLDGMT